MTSDPRGATDEPCVAAFRPADGRAAAAAETLRSLGAEPLVDPMLAVEPTGTTPTGADWVVFTSTTGVELVDEAGWTPGNVSVAAIGATTAGAARDAGWTVDLVPEEYSSAGLVAAFTDRLASEDNASPETTIELARSDHGSETLPSGLRDAGIAVRETVLYRLVRPDGAGESAVAAARGQLDAALFTSSLTVEHVLEAAADRDCRADALAGLRDATVGAIGQPTADTAREHGIAVDVVPETASFDRLATDVLDRLAE